MPYPTNDSLPPAVKKLSAKLQTAFRKAFNNAYKEYKDEKKAFATAWSVVNKMRGKKSVDLDPRIDLIESLGNIDVYRVNGEAIRGSSLADEEFTNWGDHWTLGIIPPNEVWIDRGGNESETPFFIEAALTHRKLMASGMSYDKALELADSREHAMRMKYEGTPVGKDGESPKQAHIQKLETLENDTDPQDVWLVSGDLVRRDTFPDFTEGGNSQVYRFVPAGEIWIDDALDPEERPYVILHEFTEYNLMKGGLPYNEAHKSASHKEYEARQNDFDINEMDVTRVGARSVGGEEHGMGNQILIWADELKADSSNSGFLVVEDDGTKHLPTKQGGKLSHRLMGAAWAALHGGYRGKKYSGPKKQEAIAKLKRLYAREKLETPSEKAVPPETFDDTDVGVEVSDAELNELWKDIKADMEDEEAGETTSDDEAVEHDHLHKHTDGRQHPHSHKHSQDHPVEMHSNPYVHDHLHDGSEPRPEPDPHAMKMSPIKMVGETHFAGYGLKFAKDSREKDLTGTYFKKDTNYGKYFDHAPIYYHHGLNATMDLEQVAETVKAQVDDVGIWVEGELRKSARYWKGVADLIKQGKLYYSSGTAEHLIRYGDNGSIKNWPIIEWTLTPTPAEPRLNSVAFYKSIGLDVDDEADGNTDDKRQGVENTRLEVRNDETRNAGSETGQPKHSEVDMDEKEFAAKMAEMQANATKAALDAIKAENEKVAKEAEDKRKAEEAHQAEMKSVAEKAVADFKASLPADPTQRPGYGQYNVNHRPLGDGFSFSKAIRGIAFQTDGKPNPWSGAERERDTMMKYANELKASLAEGVGNLGGYLVPPEYLQDQFIPLLRARAVVRMAGARTYPAKSDIVYIPSQTGGATAAWYGENATLTASNLTFGQLAINIRKLGALEYISNELLADSSPAADQLVKEDLANVIALKEDATYLLSNGAAPSFANAPTGFAFYPGTSAVTLTAGASGALVVGDLFKIKLTLMQANVPFDSSMAWFMSPRTWDKIAQFKDAQNRYLLETLTGGNISQYPAYGNYPEGPEGSIKGSVQGRLFGYPVYVTAQITDDNTVGSDTDCSYLFFARMNDVFIAERAGLELMASNVAGTAFASDQTWVRGIMREGLGIRHAPGVAVVSGITAA